MQQKFQSLDEIMREEEARLRAEAQARLPQEMAQWAKRREQEKARRAAIPVWVGYEGKIHGPFTNDDAAEKFVEDQKWAFADCIFRDTKEEVEDAIAEAGREDDEDEEDA